MSLSCDYSILTPVDDSDADIILRSSFTSVLALGSTEHGVRGDRFSSNKLFLIKASSVFKILLSPSSETLDQENAEALKTRNQVRHPGQSSRLMPLRGPRHCPWSPQQPFIHRHRLPTNIRNDQDIRGRKEIWHDLCSNRFRTYCGRAAPVVTAENVFRAYVIALNEV